MKKDTEKSGSKNTPLITHDGKPFEIPVEGSIGLLALGATGLMLWREKKKQAKEEDESKQKDV